MAPAPAPLHLMLLLEHAAEKGQEGKGVLVYKSFDFDTASLVQIGDVGFGTETEEKVSNTYQPPQPSLNAVYSSGHDFEVRPSPFDKENVKPKKASVSRHFPVQNDQAFDFGQNSVGDRYVPTPIGLGHNHPSKPLRPRKTEPQILNLNFEASQSNAYHISYKTLLEQAQLRAKAVNGLMARQGNKIVLLHVDNHLQGIVWFWAIVAAGGIPCLSTPFNPDENIRRKQVLNLEHKLKCPPIITTRELQDEFEDKNIPSIIIEDFEEFGTDRGVYEERAYTDEYRNVLRGRVSEEDLAILMLTSGSTGDAKAVRITHIQIFISLHGKGFMHGTGPDDVFLGWTGLDHVANLLEIHMHAMAKRAAQIHVPGPEVLQSPIRILHLIDAHRVSYTFAPNFFLFQLVQAVKNLKQPSSSHLELSNSDLEEGQSPQSDFSTSSFASSIDPASSTPDLDLSSLRCLVSGGEANVVATCAELTKRLQSYGAPASLIRPAFGMTETCAGSIYNLNFPAYDVSLNKEFASLGEPIQGLQMRCSPDGELQLRGPLLFDGYHNDQQATKDCFTADGWFHTNDLGYFDSQGLLHLTGRTKDMVIVNGVNHHLGAIESSISEAQIRGIVPTYIVVFGHRPEGCATEKLVVLYLPTYDLEDAEARNITSIAISKAVVTYCNVHPYLILPVPDSLLQKLTVGKFPRSRLRQSLEDGSYSALIAHDQIILAKHRSQTYEPATTPTEQTIIEAYTTIFGTCIHHGASISRNESLFSLGFSSIDLLKLKLHLQTALAIPNIPITTFFWSPTIAELATTLALLQPVPIPKKVQSYNPIVVLHPPSKERNGIPLFLIHPGVGDILIFMSLSHHITDRPIYALRARGFDGEPFFTCMQEIYTTYLTAIRSIEPHGPYALLGYSFGAIIAFELTKLLEAASQEVRFLGTIDQPPHFKARAASYDWYECLLTISFFLRLIPEDYAYYILPQMRKCSHDEVLDLVIGMAPKSAMESIALGREGLDSWARLALGLKALGAGYDPKGEVRGMDIFFTEPLVGLVKARDKEEWRRGFLGRWGEFVLPGEGEGNGLEGREVGVGGEVRMGVRGRGRGLRFHDVGGTHRTMISVPHVKTFAGVLIEAMRERGV